jgi:hypothetical protein
MSNFKNLCARHFSQYQLSQLAKGDDVTQRVVLDTVTIPASDFSAQDREAAATILALWAQPTRSLNNTSDEFGIVAFSRGVRVYPGARRIISVEDDFIVDTLGMSIQWFASEAEAQESVRSSLQSSYDADDAERRYGVQ